MIFLCKIYSSETDFSSLGHSLTTFLFRHILKPMTNKGYKMEKVAHLFRNGRIKRFDYLWNLSLMQRKSISLKKKMAILRFQLDLVANKIGKECLNYCLLFNAMKVSYLRKSVSKKSPLMILLRVSKCIC